MIPVLAMIVVVACLVWALASAFGGPRVGFGGLPIFIGPSWSHGGNYRGPSGLPSGGYNPPTGGSSGRSPSGGFRGGGTTGGHGGK